VRFSVCAGEGDILRDGDAVYWRDSRECAGSLNGTLNGGGGEGEPKKKKKKKQQSILLLFGARKPKEGTLSLK
jgi:hypothetical protein